MVKSGEQVPEGGQGRRGRSAYWPRTLHAEGWEDKAGRPRPHIPGSHLAKPLWVWDAGQIKISFRGGVHGRVGGALYGRVGGALSLDRSIRSFHVSTGLPKAWPRPGAVQVAALVAGRQDRTGWPKRIEAQSDCRCGFLRMQMSGATLRVGLLFLCLQIDSDKGIFVITRSYTGQF